MNINSTDREIGNHKIEIDRHFETDPESLFDYLTKPEHLTKWFAPSDTLTTEVYELDLRVGGHFQIAMIDNENDRRFVLSGEYLEIVRPSRLVYLWHWKSEQVDEVSKVTIELVEESGGTNLVLCHDQFVDQDSCDKHAEGWNGCLTRLENAIVEK